MSGDISYNKQYDIMEQLAETDGFSDDESDTYSTDSCNTADRCDVDGSTTHNCDKNENNNEKKGTAIIETYCLSEDDNQYDDWEEVNLNDVIINTMQNQNYFKDKKV